MKAQASSLSHRSIGAARLSALSILSIVLALGCGNNGESGSSGTNGNGATGGNGAAPFRGALLCSVVFAPDVGTSYFIRLVSDAELEAGEEIDSLEGAIEVGGGVSCAVQGRSAFVANFESPIITRFDEVDGALVQGERVSFANFGLTSAATAPPVILSETKAYYLDAPTSQIIVWNPSEMTAIGSIPLTVAEPPEGANQGFLAQLIDELLIVWNLYDVPPDLKVSRGDFWFVDTETDEIVATDTTEQCGNLDFPTIAANGDLYLASSSNAAINHALDLPESFPPCAIRIRAGSREIDPTYLADLNALTGGQPTGNLISVGGDRALLNAYNTSNRPVDPLLTPDEHLALLNWDFYEWELGSEQPPTRVEWLQTTTGFSSTTEFDGTTFLSRLAEDFSSTELLDLTQRPVETAYTFSGIVQVLHRLGSEPGARMAQRIEPRGGLRVLPF